MSSPSKILSDIVVYTKYARHLKSENRRETWDEIVDRNVKMHRETFAGRLSVDKVESLYPLISKAFGLVRQKKILPSMRSLQFAGKPIHIAPNRINNCAYLPIDDIAAFSETMFLLLGGTGVGYSVQYQHVNNLPPVIKPITTRRYLISDDIEGWASAIKELMKSYFTGTPRPRFDFSDIREKGAELVTSGGKAPGPDPLKACLLGIEAILESKETGSKLRPIDCHDIMCVIADAVLAGGIRRAALISLFSIDDEEMLRAKSSSMDATITYQEEKDNGEFMVSYNVYGDEKTGIFSGPDYERLKEGKVAWYYPYPYRGRANNSVVLDRSRITKERFDEIWNIVETSGSGEPGFYFTNNTNYGTNPCAEISLRPFTFCNLATIRMTDIRDQEDFEERVRAATVISTLQAAYTDFHFLRPIWKENTEKDALIGISQTGIVGNKVKLDLEKAAKVAVEVNALIAKHIGINAAARITTIKPEGTSSLAIGDTVPVASGIHAYHAAFYIRRMRFNRNEPITEYFLAHLPDLIEDEIYGPGVVISLPQRAPEGAVTREESALSMLERVKDYSLRWIRPGHNRGPNTNNVSATISIRPDEWATCREWFWEHRNLYNGLSVLPQDLGTYTQAPFEDCTEEEYNKMYSKLKDIDLTQIREEYDGTDLKGEIACGGSVGCEVT